MINRRQFTLGTASMAFAGLTLSGLGVAGTKAVLPVSKGYGKLTRDPKNIIDLPKGFSYEVISEFGELMSDGLHVPDRADGMGCIGLTEDTVALIRNHELHPAHLKKQPDTIRQHKTKLSYDQYSDKVALPGGTSTIIYDLKKKQRKAEFISLTGTIRNCAGGITPWGSWLTCEESVDTSASIDGISEEHGYIFEVPANATALVNAKPLKAMGRFNHEAAAVDPATGIVYLTEDRNDSLFYRFIPNEYGKLAKGGKLQALVIKGMPKFDSRNWEKSDMALNSWLDTQWVDIDNPESPKDDLRKQGFEKGATLFARGEGIHWAPGANEKEGELYFCCTSGGNKKLGQIMRYQPSPLTDDLAANHKAKSTSDGLETSGRIQLFLESTDPSLFNFGDNLTVAPNGHLIVCEDQYSDVVDNHLRGVTPQGEVYPFAQIRVQTEPAGTCFSPDGKVLFVNLYSPTKTLAIYGPWQSLV